MSDCEVEKMENYMSQPLPEPKPKVYEMNEFDWWADFSPEEAKINYYNHIDIHDDDESEPIELTIEQMSILKYTADVFDSSNKIQIISFQDQLDLMIKNGEKFPCFFASTEY